MTTPPESNDPFLQSLVEETKGLPQIAAAHARSRQQARTRMARVGASLAVLLLGFSFWFLNQTSDRKIADTQVMPPSEAADSTRHQGYVRVYQEGERPEESIPPDASEREKELLTQLPGVPLLIVKNEAGQITRVQIFER